MSTCRRYDLRFGLTLAIHGSRPLSGGEVIVVYFSQMTLEWFGFIIIIIINDEFHRDASLETKLQGRFLIRVHQRSLIA